MTSLRVIFCCLLFGASACKLMSRDEAIAADPAFAAMLENYYAERMVLYPLEATANGDNRYNDRLPIDFTACYQDTLRRFYLRFGDSLSRFPRRGMNAEDQISHDVFRREIAMGLEAQTPAIAWHARYMPFDQFNGLPLALGQMGSGTGNQPFKTLTDYDNWMRRAGRFSAWADSAIASMRTGVAKGYLLPRCLIVKMIPQLEAMQVADVKQSLFYGPVNGMPAQFSPEDKTRVESGFTVLIRDGILPAYARLAVFLRTEYLPKARATAGIDGDPDGQKYYDFCVRYWTTTKKTAEEIYQTGLAEVARIHGELENTKTTAGFTGDLPAFFEYMNTDPKFRPFKTPAEILARYEAIHRNMLPQLHSEFEHTPKMAFEVRQTEAFRAASASAEYLQGTPDGSRPGIFYVPILAAGSYTTPKMESLFLHEAIPGHHYQNALQIEDSLLPKFRRFAWYGAYGEGWGLYAESLGKELGLYKDPYSYAGALGAEMHRAIRLVVDVAIHQKKMTREEAIRYMTTNEPISEEAATAEIERYIAWPGQALSYKIGALKIRELRERYSEMLGDGFHIAAFHDAVLSDGVLPLDVLERKMGRWAAQQE